MTTDYTKGSWKIEQPQPPDLLFRLRHPQFATYPAHGSGFVPLATDENVADMKEAADLIERLQSELKEAWDQRQAYYNLVHL